MYRTVIENKLSNNFILSIPKLLKKLLLDNYKQNSYMYTTLDMQLKNNYNVTTKQLIAKADKFVRLSHYGNKLIVAFDNNIYLTPDLKLTQMIQLIDDGLIGIRGTNLFSNAFTYLKNNIHIYNRFYIMKGGNVKWV